MNLAQCYMIVVRCTALRYAVEYWQVHRVCASKAFDYVYVQAMPDLDA